MMRVMRAAGDSFSANSIYSPSSSASWCRLRSGSDDFINKLVLGQLNDIIANDQPPRRHLPGPPGLHDRRDVTRH